MRQNPLESHAKAQRNTIFGSGPAAAHTRQLKVAIRSHRPAGARELVPQGHLIVAHHEVVGKGVKDSSVR
jgi:hypothetical protein